MKRVTLNGEKMPSKEAAHRYIKEKLKTPEYCGENLDALWDVLSTYDQRIKFRLINIDKLMESLGEYGDSLLRVFQDAEKENDNIILEIIY